MSRRPYIRPISRFGWWLKQQRYVRYMLRELSCVFIGAYTLLLVLGLYRLYQGREAFDAYLANIFSPAGLLFSSIALLFAVYHTITWFQVTPKAMPLRIGAKPIPGSVIIAAHWLGWAIITAVIFVLVGM